METLPIDTIRSILFFLDLKSLVFGISLVSSRFLSISNEELLWKYFYSQFIGGNIDQNSQTKHQFEMKRISGSEETFSWKKLFIDSYIHSYAVIGGAEDDPQDIVKQLNAAGIPRVDIIYSDLRTPTLEELLRYRAVLIFAHSVYSHTISFLNGKSLGDVIYEYVQHGRGVVVCAMAGSNNMESGSLAGKFLPYHPFVPNYPQNTNVNAGLGKVYYPEHPVMQNVKKLNNGTSCRCGCEKVSPNSKLIASFDGEANHRDFPLIAELNRSHKEGKVIGLNFFPGSTGLRSYWHNFETDEKILMANSLRYCNPNHVPYKF